MPEMKVHLLRGDKVDNNADYRDSLPVNMYAVRREILGAAGYMVGWYGITPYATGSGVDRGGVWVANNSFDGHYRVSGNSLISIDEFGVTTELGEIPGSGQVSMTYSFLNLAIVADGKLFYYNDSDGLRRITGANLGIPIDITWSDSYFILTDGETIYHSTLADEEVFAALDFGVAQSQPDATYGVARNEDNEILAFGQFTVEPFRNAGTANFAFARIALKSQNVGILGTHCKTEIESVWYVIGREENKAPTAYVLQGGQRDEIATREVQKVFDTYKETQNELQSSVVESYGRDGVNFVVFHLPNETLLYNATLAQSMGNDVAWSIIKTGRDDFDSRAFRGINAVRDPRNSTWIVGDRFNTSIGELDESVATQYGDIAEWYLYSPMIKLEKMSINKLEVETIPGMVPLDADSDDQTVFVSMSYDGRIHGKEWTKEQGRRFDYNNRFIIRLRDYVRNYASIRMRSTSRTRMAFANLKLGVM